MAESSENLGRFFDPSLKISRKDLLEKTQNIVADYSQVKFDINLNMFAVNDIFPNVQGMVILQTRILSYT